MLNNRFLQLSNERFVSKMKKCDKCCFRDFHKKEACRDLEELVPYHVATSESFCSDQLFN